MKHLYATYCSAHKRTDPGMLPAAERYQSSRIRHLVEQARTDNHPAAILSGQFGLVCAEEPLPWYDHLLQEAEITDMTHQVQQTLQEWGVGQVTWLTAALKSDPNLIRYQTVMAQACRASGTVFVVAEWPA